MNKIVKLALVLFLICAITAGVLGAVNELTKDRIAEINRQKTETAYSLVLKSSGYEEVYFNHKRDLLDELVDGELGQKGYWVDGSEEDSAYQRSYKKYLVW